MWTHYLENNNASSIGRPEKIDLGFFFKELQINDARNNFNSQFELIV